MSRPVVAVFGSSAVRPGESEYAEAVRLGEMLAERGFVVANGGYAGVMEAVSEGVGRRAGSVIGYTAPMVFPTRSGANAHITEERPAPTLTERIHAMLSGADAVIALPGSIGTFTELIMAWNVVHVDRLYGRPAMPVVAVGERWRHLVSAVGDELDVDRAPITCVDGIDAAAAAIADALRVRSAE